MGAPIGHWVDRQAQRIAREHKVVGVISSRSAKESGVHAKAFDKEGSSAITLDDVSQLDADALILELMGGDAANSGARLNALGLSLIARGATAVWWGCTELGGSEDIKVSYPVFEPMDGMVEQALHLWGLAE
jgi:aspartate/glutamate racemase